MTIRKNTGKGGAAAIARLNERGSGEETPRNRMGRVLDETFDPTVGRGGVREFFDPGSVQYTRELFEIANAPYEQVVAVAGGAKLLTDK